MKPKTVPISARISLEDAEFLSQFEIDGAKTPSDKLRAILAQARLRQQGLEEYSDGLALMREIYLPVLERLQRAEYASATHSELVSRLLQWLPDMCAYVASGVTESKEGETSDALAEFERGAADRIFRLTESIMQLGVTKQNPCYEQDAVNRRIGTVLELAAVISKLQQSK